MQSTTYMYMYVALCLDMIKKFYVVTKTEVQPSTVLFQAIATLYIYMYMYMLSWYSMFSWYSTRLQLWRMYNEHEHVHVYTLETGNEDTLHVHVALAIPVHQPKQ